jgi:LuxR family transcriptional regulator, maltose regulon positive regulatory protein
VRDARENAHRPLFRRHARRPRLTVLLDEATAQSIILTAPAGYGKTTLAREWLQGREHAAWYRATPASADVGAFSAGLADAVAPVVPGAGERVRQRLRVGDATERLARPLAELLAEDLEAWPAGAVIVLDDYHLMAESAPVETFLDWLLMLAPIRVLVTTRRRPGWATARRFLYDEAYEIGRAQLAMTEEEATRVLEGRSTEAVHALVRQAGGWPAVIGLAALSAELAFPKEKASESLYRYFAEEVLRAEPAAVQRLMLAAAVPSAITVRLAEDVLGLDDPEPDLLRLRDEGLLHEIPTGELVFHPLIQDFLRRRLESDDPGRLAALRRLVVDDARARARWEEAFDLSLQADRPDEAAEIVGCSARSLLAHGQGETLEKWLAACGAAGVTVPGAALARAELLIRKGEMSAAAAVARDTARRLTPDHPDYAWACNATGRALHFTSQEDEAFRAFEKGRRAASNDEDLKDALWGQLLAITEIDPTKMPVYLDELESRYSNDLDVRLRLAVGRYGTAEQTHSVAGEWSRFAALLDSLEYSKDALASTSFLAIASVVARFSADYGLSRDLAERAVRMCRELRFDLGLGASLLHLAAAELGLRSFRQAHQNLVAFRRTTISREDPFYQVESLTLKARLHAYRGDLSAALATHRELVGIAAPPRALGSHLAAHAILLAASGDVDTARNTNERARENGSNIEMIYFADLADAIIQDVSGDHDAFNVQAAQLVTDCDQAGYLDGLVFAYRVYPRLLSAAISNAEAAGVLARLLVRSRDFKLAHSEGIEMRVDEADEPLGGLTRRELEVLTLLSQGLSNSEIATRLFITPSTAKVHVRNIFAKLGVRTRLQAALRAHELLELEQT